MPVYGPEDGTAKYAMTVFGRAANDRLVGLGRILAKVGQGLLVYGSVTLLRRWVERMNDTSRKARFEQAMKSGEIDVVNTLLKEHPEYIGLKDAVGNTPVHWAVYSGDVETLERVLKSVGGASLVHIGNHEGRTPLQLTGLFDHNEAAAVILAKVPDNQLPPFKKQAEQVQCGWLVQLIEQKIEKQQVEDAERAAAQQKRLQARQARQAQRGQAPASQYDIRRRGRPIGYADIEKEFTDAPEEGRALKERMDTLMREIDRDPSSLRAVAAYGAGVSHEFDEWVMEAAELHRYLKNGMDRMRPFMEGIKGSVVPSCLVQRAWEEPSSFEGRRWKKKFEEFAEDFNAQLPAFREGLLAAEASISAMDGYAETVTDLILKANQSRIEWLQELCAHIGAAFEVLRRYDKDYILAEQDNRPALLKAKHAFEQRCRTLVSLRHHCCREGLQQRDMIEYLEDLQDFYHRLQIWRKHADCFIHGGLIDVSGLISLAHGWPALEADAQELQRKGDAILDRAVEPTKIPVALTALFENAEQITAPRQLTVGAAPMQPVDVHAAQKKIPVPRS